MAEPPMAVGSGVVVAARACENLVGQSPLEVLVARQETSSGTDHKVPECASRTIESWS